VLYELMWCLDCGQFFIERAGQELEEVTSVSRMDRSLVKVEIKMDFAKTKDDLEQVWDKLRRKVSDVQRQLPPGAGPSFVNDDFGDVYTLIIALRMLVDNAIVVTDGILVRTRRGQDPAKAASEVVEATKWPLLGGTAVGILAFSAIGLSPTEMGEYAGSLFWVILYSMLLSWLFAVTLTPLFCMRFLKAKASPPGTSESQPVLDRYRGLLHTVLPRPILCPANSPRPCWPVCGRLSRPSTCRRATCSRGMASTRRPARPTRGWRFPRRLASRPWCWRSS
jgi:multidrug efflux pump subunit AcrB